MKEERCEISDLLVSQCAHCRAGGGLQSPAELTEASVLASVREHGPLFFAKHRGPCSGCDRGIWPDDTIRADGQGGYLHEDCAVSGELPAGKDQLVSFASS